MSYMSMSRFVPFRNLHEPKFVKKCIFSHKKEEEQQEEEENCRFDFQPIKFIPQEVRMQNFVKKFHREVGRNDCHRFHGQDLLAHFFNGSFQRVNEPEFEKKWCHPLRFYLISFAQALSNLLTQHPFLATFLAHGYLTVAPVK